MDDFTPGEMFGITEQRSNELIKLLSDILEGKSRRNGLTDLIKYVDTNALAKNEMLWACFMTALLVTRKRRGD